ncbi:hypothetical protein J6590_039609 [Homalodisca vitripennis]|nr:hypothetical protein J6590_039609 [Homalodisca vitripennis]
MTDATLHDSHVVLGPIPASLVLVLMEEERISRKEKCSASLQRRLFLYFWKREDCAERESMTDAYSTIHMSARPHSSVPCSRTSGRREDIAERESMTSCILHDSHVVLGLTPAPLVLVLLEEERIARKEKV